MFPSNIFNSVPVTVNGVEFNVILVAEIIPVVVKFSSLKPIVPDEFVIVSGVIVKLLSLSFILRVFVLTIPVVVKLLLSKLISGLVLVILLLLILILPISAELDVFKVVELIIPP